MTPGLRQLRETYIPLLYRWKPPRYRCQKGCRCKICTIGQIWAALGRSGSSGPISEIKGPELSADACENKTLGGHRPEGRGGHGDPNQETTEELPKKLHTQTGII